MQAYKDQLAASRQLLLSELQNISASAFNMKVSEEVWSIAQTCQHILMAERLFYVAIMKALKKESTAEESRHALASIYDYATPLAAPSVVVPEYRQYDLEQLVNALQQCRASMLALLEDLEEYDFNYKSYTHIYFGELTIAQWFELTAAHEHRHVLQIRKLKQQVMKY